MKNIAVVGGGFGGLTTAYYLQKKGYSVTVYEKDTRVGGKCLSVYKSRDVCELGCVFGASKYLLNLMHELDIENGDRYYYRNFVTKEGKKVPQVAFNKLNSFKEQYNKLPKVLKKYREILKAPGLRNIPKELCLNFEKWCYNNQLEELLAVFAPQFTAFGYGRLKDTPAIYVLKHFDLETLNDFIEIRKLISFSKGISELIFKLANYLKDIRYNAKVTKIIGGDKVTVETNFSKELFDAVILTVPIEPNNIENTRLANLMRHYQYTYYNVFAYCIEGCLSAATYFCENFNKEDGKLLLAFNATSQTDESCITSYSYGNLPFNILKNKMDKDLEYAGIKTKFLFAHKCWINFPHVTREILEQGFYDELSKMQGKNGIYCAGGLTCFSNLDKLTEYAQTFVESYF